MSDAGKSRGRVKDASKLKHCENEAARRNRLREKFLALSNLLDTEMGEEDGTNAGLMSGSSRIQVLQAAIDMIKDSKSKIAQLEATVARLTSAGTIPHQLPHGGMIKSTGATSSSSSSSNSLTRSATSTPLPPQDFARMQAGGSMSMNHAAAASQMTPYQQQQHLLQMQQLLSTMPTATSPSAPYVPPSHSPHPSSYQSMTGGGPSIGASTSGMYNSQMVGHHLPNHLNVQIPNAHTQYGDIRTHTYTPATGGGGGGHTRSNSASSFSDGLTPTSATSSQSRKRSFKGEPQTSYSHNTSRDASRERHINSASQSLNHLHLQQQQGDQQQMAMYQQQQHQSTVMNSMVMANNSGSMMMMNDPIRGAGAAAAAAAASTGSVVVESSDQKRRRTSEKGYSSCSSRDESPAGTSGVGGLSRDTSPGPNLRRIISPSSTSSTSASLLPPFLQMQTCFVTSLDGQFLDASHGFLDLVGLQHEQLMRQSIFSMLHPSESLPTLNSLQTLLHGGMNEEELTGIEDSKKIFIRSSSQVGGGHVQLPMRMVLFSVTDRRPSAQQQQQDVAMTGAVPLLRVIFGILVPYDTPPTQPHQFVLGSIACLDLLQAQCSHMLDMQQLKYLVTVMYGVPKSRLTMGSTVVPSSSSSVGSVGPPLQRSRSSSQSTPMVRPVRASSSHQDLASMTLGAAHGPYHHHPSPSAPPPQLQHQLSTHPNIAQQQQQQQQPYHHRDKSRERIYSPLHAHQSVHLLASAPPPQVSPIDQGEHEHGVYHPVSTLTVNGTPTHSDLVRHHSHSPSPLSHHHHHTLSSPLPQAHHHTPVTPMPTIYQTPVPHTPLDSAAGFDHMNHHAAASHDSHLMDSGGVGPGGAVHHAAPDLLFQPTHHEEVVTPLFRIPSTESDTVKMELFP